MYHLVKIKYHLILLLLTVVTLHSSAFTVVLDAGHGGKDPGAVGTFMREKNINLDMVLELGRLIEENHPDVKVIYTRKTDVFVELSQRSNIANKSKANLFISIHTNASKSKQAYGTETYTLGLNRTDENFEISKRENSVITLEKDYKQRYEGFDPNSPESYIIFEFMQDRHMEQSIELAREIQKRFSSHCGRVDREVRQAAFWVLRGTTMPSVLIEVGYISNINEELFLSKKENRDQLSAAIYQAFKKYKQEVDRKSGVKAATAPAASQGTPTPSSASPSAKRETEPADKQQPDSQEKALFKVQLATYKERLKPTHALFKGIKGVEYYQEEGLYKYTVGSSTDFNQINKLRKEVAHKIPTAFIVAFYKGKRISHQQAIQINQ